MPYANKEDERANRRKNWKQKAAVVNARRRKRRAERKTEKAPRYCANCGAAIPGARTAKAKYCVFSCSQKAYRARHPERVGAARKARYKANRERLLEYQKTRREKERERSRAERERSRAERERERAIKRAAAVVRERARALAKSKTPQARARNVASQQRARNNAAPAYIRRLARARRLPPLTPNLLAAYSDALLLKREIRKANHVFANASIEA